MLAWLGGFLVLSSPPQIANNLVSLFISPPAGVFFIDKNFTVALNLKAKSSINAAEAALTFNPETVEVVSIAKENSIFSLWLKEPAFSNVSGSVEFAGLAPNGYQGIGKLFTITFKPKKAGSTALAFSRASVLANDGAGTEILKETIGASFTLKSQDIVPADFNNDGEVNLQDISILLSYWSSRRSARYRSTYDLNQDGEINLVDISILLNQAK